MRDVKANGWPEAAKNNSVAAVHTAVWSTEQQKYVPSVAKVFIRVTLVLFNLTKYKMSQKTYNEQWGQAQRELSCLLTDETPDEPPPPELDRVVFFKRVARFYVRYIQVFRQLDKAYDLLVHPQKREVLREILDGVMGRLLELKKDMVEAEFSEFHYMDDIVQTLKLTPTDLQLPIPHYFITEHSKERTDILQDIALVKAIETIQAVERARQARMKAKLKKMSKVVNGDGDDENDDEKKVDMIEVSAALRIQKLWRGYVQRKIIAQESILTSQEAKMDLHIIISQANDACTRIKQQEYMEDYHNSIASITKEVKDLGPDMSNTMKDRIRQWFLKCRHAAGIFPEYPDDIHGGGALILVDKDPLQVMKEIAAQKEEDKNNKLKGKDEKKGKQKDGKKGKVKEEGLRMQNSAFLSDLQEANKQFKEFWETCDESNNFHQRHLAQIIRDEKKKIFDAEIQLEVDEQMRLELAAMKLAVDNIKGGKAKGKKGKKGGGKGKKGKQVVDLTADRTLESLCQELVEQNLLKATADISLSEYTGNYSYLGAILRENAIEPTPALLDVRQLLTLYAVLPLGSRAVHQKGPLITSILLVGPAGIGKKMLVQAVCNETQAALFDLSPMNTAGKYPGDDGLNMMLHMVFKVAKLLQPSVIWIGDAEKMFYKKVPKHEEELTPKRLATSLPKYLKLIKGDDRVLILGTAEDPICANIRALCKTFGKILFIPRPDYGARFILWKELIKRYNGEVTEAIDFSSLAKMSEGYTPGLMIQVIQQVVTKRRIRWQGFRPLTTAEFVAHIVAIDPAYKKKEDALKKWYGKTPLGKKKIAFEKKKAKEEEGNEPKK